MTPPLARHITLRNESRKTDGWKVAKIAQALGKPLFPAQRYICDVAGEIDPETGTYYYQRVITTVQRQFGKTETGFAKMCQNALNGPKRRIWYLAQSGKDADNKFLDFLKNWEKSPMSLVTQRPKLGKGNISLPFINDSELRPSASTDSSGHGYQGDQITIDEAWSLSADQGKFLLDAFVPTTITRQQATGIRPQIWILSTEGDSGSTFLNGLLDRCREGDIPPRWAFFDFGVPEDEDPDDMNVLAKYHPACYHLFRPNQLEDFKSEFITDGSFDRGGWLRAFANIRDTGTADRFLAESLWNQTATGFMTASTLEKSTGIVAIGCAVTLDATKTVISIANQTDGHTIVQISDILDGTGSSIPRLKELQDRYHAQICMDSRGPSADLHSRLTTEGLDMVAMSATDFMSVGQAFVSSLEQSRTSHATDPDLDTAARAATRTWSGDAWKINRKAGEGSSILESVMLAVYAANHDDHISPVQVF
jgi:phage terminase large subunit-like protein